MKIRTVKVGKEKRGEMERLIVNKPLPNLLYMVKLLSGLYNPDMPFFWNVPHFWNSKYAALDSFSVLDDLK